MPVRLRVPAGLGVDAVHVRSVVDAEPTFTHAVALESEPGEDGATWWQGDVVVGNPVVVVPVPARDHGRADGG